MNPADALLWVANHWWQTAIGVWTGVLTATLALCRAARDDDRPTPPNPNPPLLASVTVDDADWLRAHNITP